ALAQPARARDAVDGLIVDRDADGAGEVVDEPRRAARPVALHRALGDLVELLGRHTRPDVAARLAQHRRHGLARGLQALDVPWIVSRQTHEGRGRTPLREEITLSTRP